MSDNAKQTTKSSAAKAKSKEPKAIETAAAPKATKAPKTEQAITKSGDGYTVKKISDIKTEITLTIDKATFDKATIEAYNKTKGKYSVQGFRKGKVPKRILESLYGEDVFFDDAIQIAFPEKYYEILNAENIMAVDSPTITNIKNGENGDYIFTATVETMPEVVLGEYKGLKLNKIKHNVSEKDILAEIEKEQVKFSREVEVNRETKLGDIATIDFVGSVDGIEFEGGAGQDYPLALGSGSFIPGFEEQLVGLKSGAVKDVNVTFPAQYNAEHLAGKEAVFKCTVKKVAEKVLPELNDEFAKDVSEFDTLKEYKQSIKAALAEKAKEREKRDNEQMLFDKITANTKFEVPDALVAEQQRYMIEDLANKLKESKLSLEQYFMFMGTTKEQYLENTKKDASQNVKFRIIIEKIIEAEKLEANQNELQAEAEKRATAQGITAAKYISDLKRGLESLRQIVEADKVINFLLENNKFE